MLCTHVLFTPIIWLSLVIITHTHVDSHAHDGFDFEELISSEIMPLGKKKCILCKDFLLNKIIKWGIKLTYTYF